jgi:hypothetical protein
MQQAQISVAGGEKKRGYNLWNGMEAIGGSCIRGRVVADWQVVRGVGRPQEAEFSV